MTSRRRLLALAGMQLGDAVFNLVPSAWIDDDLDRLQLPRHSRYLFGSLKLASAIGLLMGLRRPAIGRLTARALAAYFVFALAAHVRVRDQAFRYAPAALMLAWSVRAVGYYS